MAQQKVALIGAMELARNLPNPIEVTITGYLSALFTIENPKMSDQVIEFINERG